MRYKVMRDFSLRFKSIAILTLIFSVRTICYDHIKKDDMAVYKLDSLDNAIGKAIHAYASYSLNILFTIPQYADNVRSNQHGIQAFSLKVVNMYMGRILLQKTFARRSI